MTYLTTPQLLKAYDAGDLELVDKTLSRYGEIIRDRETERPNGTLVRERNFTYRGKSWNTRKENGEVMCAGHCCWI